MNTEVNSARLAALDLLRGFAITAMVFFSLNRRFTSETPVWLQHNLHDSFQAGDLVFPLFLFTSGMSLGIWRERAHSGEKRRWLKLAWRIGLQVCISLFLSPFSANAPGGMDEVMANAVLSLPCVLLAGFPSRVVVGVGSMILLAWLPFHGLVDPKSAYLGGYQAVAFYFPVMLGGVIAVRMRQHLIMGGLSCLAIAALLSIWIAPIKMYCAPTFMLYSLGFSFLALFLSGRVRNGVLEYLGRRPLRYWVLMHFIIIVPLHLRRHYGEPFEFHWLTSNGIALFSVAALYGVARTIDLLQWCFRGRARS